MKTLLVPETNTIGNSSCLRDLNSKVYQFYIGELESLFHVGGIAFDRATGKLIMSVGARSILGFSGTHPVSDADEFLSRVHEEDRSRVRQILAGKSTMARGDAIPFRLMAPTGIVRWCRCIAVGQPDASNGYRRTAFILLWLGEYPASSGPTTGTRRTSRSPSSPQANPAVIGAVADYLRRISPELADARSEEVSQLISESCGKMVPVASLPSICYSKLTFRELEICAGISSGKTTKQIGSELYISSETVRTTRKGIRRKLGLKLRRQSLYSFLKSA